MARPVPYISYAQDRVTVGVTPVGVTAANLVTSPAASPSNAPVADTQYVCSRVEIFVESHPIRITYADNATPVAGVNGDVIQSGASFAIEGAHDVSRLLMVSEDGSNAICHVDYLRG